MNHLRPSFQRLAIAATSVLIASCGGGGGGGAAPAPSLGGVIKGLQPSTGGETFTLRLNVSGVTEALTTQAYGDFQFRFAREFANGQTYTVQVAQHPRNQLCSVQQGGSVKVQGPVNDVVIECHTTVLNDTGLAAAPDGQAGRDAEALRLTKRGAGVLGFDFTRLCATGAEVVNGQCPVGTFAGAADQWRCTRDNVTGLVWLKDAGVGLAAPAGELCGVRGWRLPSVHELLSIVHAGAPSPAASIDADHFPATPAADFVTAEPYLEPALGTAGGTWAVGFGGAGYAGKNVTPAALAVRWVAGTSKVADAEDGATGAFTCTTTDSNFVLVDSRRGLTWAVPRNTQALSWDAAVASVAAVNTQQRPGGHGDWRLPNRNELDSLAMRSHTNPAVHPGVAACQLDRFSTVFWSASPNGAAAAWTVSFEDGSVSAMDKAVPARVIYVRNRALNSTE